MDLPVEEKEAREKKDARERKDRDVEDVVDVEGQMIDRRQYWKRFWMAFAKSLFRL